jgi:hypothetical protein
MLHGATVPTSHNRNSGLEYLLVSASTGTNRDHFLQAVLIRTMPNWITSESPPIRPEQPRESIRKTADLICPAVIRGHQIVGIVPPSIM